MTFTIFNGLGIGLLVLGLILVIVGRNKEMTSGKPYTQQEKGLMYGGYTAAIVGLVLIGYGYFVHPQESSAPTAMYYF